MSTACARSGASVRPTQLRERRTRPASSLARLSGPSPRLLLFDYSPYPSYDHGRREHDYTCTLNTIIRTLSTITRTFTTTIPVPLTPYLRRRRPRRRCRTARARSAARPSPCVPQRRRLSRSELHSPSPPLHPTFTFMPALHCTMAHCRPPARHSPPRSCDALNPEIPF